VPVPEIEAMAAMAEALDALTADERGRVLRWAAERYGAVQAPAPPVDPPNLRTDVGDVAVTPNIGQAVGVTRQQTFDHFAELYDAFNPQNDAERALIGGYWQQVILGKTSFMAGHVNKELRDLGHAVTAINKAMTANMGKKPALVLQLKRSGTTQQARKTLKLSGEGIKSVESRLNIK